MQVSTNEIRVRAQQFVREWKGRGEEKRDTQSFYNEFFEMFGVQRRRVARYEQLVDLPGKRKGFIDLYWPKVLLVEQKSAGRDLARAASQADEYFDSLPDDDKPRFRMVCDFEHFQLLDRDTRDLHSFTLDELPKKIELFDFIRGREKRVYRDQDPVNIKASEIMGALHDALEEGGYRGHDLERFLVRLVFMLFADDTGIFEPRDHLLFVLEDRTSVDGADTGLWLNRIFEVLDTPENERGKNLDEDLARFPYVNGGLFAERLRTPDFTSAMREKLLVAARFNWAEVSPAIFGSLFQSVMDAGERRKKGAHYTTEKNILKVLGPLFLDNLRAEFEGLKRLTRGRDGQLEAFRRRLGTLTFLDPACGCGNFLIIAYRELRQLEIEVLRELSSANQLNLDVRDFLSVIDVDQFYGIEKEEFPARIAETAMWMIDHIMNNRMSQEFGVNFVRIPLAKSPHIRHADALETDWNSLLPAHQCSFVFGNPPFIGAKMQSEDQRSQVRAIAKLGGSGGTLDYVCAWFLKAGAYVQEGRARIAFVSTNSITQGEQVAQLWPLIFDRYRLEIAFAHRTFAWGSEARGVAHVHVVIIGLTRRDDEPPLKRLFSYDDLKGDPVESSHKALTAYLTDGERLANRHVVVKEEGKPINDAKKAITGTQPLEGGYLTFTRQTMMDFLRVEPDAADLFLPFPGAFEFINGVERFILHTQGVSPTRLFRLPEVVKRLASVQQFRGKSTRDTTLRLSQYPSQYGVNVLPTKPFLALPQTSSENRQYVPFGWLSPPTIPSEKLRLIENPTITDFAVLTSAMHMAWMRTVTGRMKSDYMYSVGVVYNTFPWPEIGDADEAKLGRLAQAVLDARAAWPEATLADLYDPLLMPANLRKAHADLDRAVDRLYRSAPFASERERVEHLFALYEKLVSPVEAAAKGKRGRGRA